MEGRWDLTHGHAVVNRHKRFYAEWPQIAVQDANGASIKALMDERERDDEEFQGRALREIPALGSA
jgi:hypothetical protein